MWFVFGVLNNIVDIGVSNKWYRYWTYFILLLTSSQVIYVSFKGFRESRGFGAFSVELGLGYTFPGFMVDMAFILFFLIISCSMFDRVKEEKENVVKRKDNTLTD